MRFLRTTSTRRLVLLLASILAIAAGGTAIALAGGNGPVPAPKPLADAVHDALSAPQVQGISARVAFTNHLIDSSSMEGSNPILTGATGRLWVTGDHRIRLELQSDNGDAQIVSDGKSFWVYDGASNTVYRGSIPQRAAPDAADAHAPPSLAQVQDGLSKLIAKADVSGASPSDVAGQPAYTVRLQPKQNGGLLGAAELAWDAARGVPLRAAVYARGSSSPVLELRATDVSYGPVPDSTFAIAPPTGAKTVDLTPSAPAGGTDHADGKPAKPVTDPAAVAKALPFALSAPATLAGQARNEVRLLDWKGSPAALVTYGEGLGGIAVIERQAKPGDAAPAPTRHDREGARLTLPTVSINGATGQVLETALGTAVQFERGGVAYTVLGSVPRADGPGCGPRGL